MFIINIGLNLNGAPAATVKHMCKWRGNSMHDRQCTPNSYGNTVTVPRTSRGGTAGVFYPSANLSKYFTTALHENSYIVTTTDKIQIILDAGPRNHVKRYAKTELVTTNGATQVGGSPPCSELWAPEVQLS